MHERPSDGKGRKRNYGSGMLKPRMASLSWWINMDVTPCTILEEPFLCVFKHLCVVPGALRENRLMGKRGVSGRICHRT